MSKAAKAWLIAAVFLIAVGCITGGIMMSLLNWDFTKLSTDTYVTNRYEIEEAYQSISITTDTADIALLPAENEVCTVVCHEQENVKHTVSVKDGTLVIEAVDTRKWYQHIGIHFSSPRITVYLPQAAYGTLTVRTDTGKTDVPSDFRFDAIDIKTDTGYVKVLASVLEGMRIKTSTGAITVEGSTAKTVELSVSTGKISLSQVTCAGDMRINVSTGKTIVKDTTCGNLYSTGSTGDLALERVIVAGMLSAERSTGDVRLDSCDAAELLIDTDTGSVTGSLLSEKVFLASSDTGRISVPETTTGGRCKITTDTGNIDIRIQK